MNITMTQAQMSVQLTANTASTVELTDSDLAIVTGACGGGCASDGISLGLGLGLGGGCGSNDPQIWGGSFQGGWNDGGSFGGGLTYLPIPAPCHHSCSDPCH